MLANVSSPVFYICQMQYKETRYMTASGMGPH